MIYLIIYLLGFILSYRLLRKSIRKEIENDLYEEYDWGVVATIVLISYLSWFVVLILLLRQTKIKGPPKWL